MTAEERQAVDKLIAQWRQSCVDVELEIRSGLRRHTEGPHYGIAAVQQCADELESVLAPLLAEVHPPIGFDNHHNALACPYCNPKGLTFEATPLRTIQALKNSGIDTECGACMEVAFTGVTTNEHTCKSHRRRPNKGWSSGSA